MSFAHQHRSFRSIALPYRRLVVLLTFCWLTSTSIDSSLASEIDGTTVVIGLLRPSQQSVLRPMTAGNVSKIHVREGDVVTAGTAIVTLDDRLARSRLDVAQSQAKQTGQLRSAKVDLDLLKSELKYLRDAVRTGAATTYELERKEGETQQAEAALESAKAEKMQLDAAVRLATVELDLLTISAPFDGEVIRIHPDRGSSVATNEDVVTFAQLDHLLTEMFVPMAFHSQMHGGKTYLLKPELPGLPRIEAVLRHVSPVMHSTTRSFRCVFEIDNRDRSIPCGIHVELELTKQN